MERIRQYFGKSKPASYSALTNDDVQYEQASSTEATQPISSIFSAFEYWVFMLLGVAMLYSWNCFLAAAAYFQTRFDNDPVVRKNFLPSILVVSTVATLATTLAMSALQKGAKYTYRISCFLIINVAVFVLLALSTVIWTNISPRVYLAFLLVMVVSSSFASGLAQNGLFSFGSSFGPMSAQAIMTGQGIAGILPAIAQIVSVLVVPPKHKPLGDPTGSSKSAFIYFLTALVISIIALLCFFALLKRHAGLPIVSGMEVADGDTIIVIKKSVSLWSLAKKLKYMAYAIFFTFCVTMFFPVFTQLILSVNNTAPTSRASSRIFTPEVFIPIGFFVWNSGDLIGRVICAVPYLTLPRPGWLAFLSLARVVFIPMYLLCNINGAGAVIRSDAFYFLVQFLFGLSNGWLGSNTMMAAPQFVDDDEKEATGGFMGLCLVAGLATGSLLTFAYTN